MSALDPKVDDFLVLQMDGPWDCWLSTDQKGTTDQDEANREANDIFMRDITTPRTHCLVVRVVRVLVRDYDPR